MIPFHTISPSGLLLIHAPSSPRFSPLSSCDPPLRHLSAPTANPPPSPPPLTPHRNGPPPSLPPLARPTHHIVLPAPSHPFPSACPRRPPSATPRSPCPGPVLDRHTPLPTRFNRAQTSRLSAADTGSDSAFAVRHRCHCLRCSERGKRHCSASVIGWDGATLLRFGQGGRFGSTSLVLVLLRRSVRVAPSMARFIADIRRRFGGGLSWAWEGGRAAPLASGL